MEKLPNIYTVLKKIKFEQKINKHINDCKNDSTCYTEFIVVSNFIFRIIQEFYEEILNNLPDVEARALPPIEDKEKVCNCGAHHSLWEYEDGKCATCDGKLL